MLYAGVDAHRTATHVTLVNETGNIVARRRIPSCDHELRKFFASYHEPIKAVVEASYNWGLV